VPYWTGGSESHLDSGLSDGASDDLGNYSVTLELLVPPLISLVHLASDTLMSPFNQTKYFPAMCDLQALGDQKKEVIKCLLFAFALE
jgi:hypothetical protein